MCDTKKPPTLPWHLQTMDMRRLMQAAKLSLCLLDLAHDAVYTLYPDELSTIRSFSDQELAATLIKAFSEQLSDRL